MTGPKNSAAGISGWTYEWLRPLVNDEVCMARVTVIVADIVNGTASQRVAQYLFAARMICIKKDVEGKKLRPIAIQEVFYRIASAYVSRLLLKHCKPNLSPLQYGMSDNGVD